MACEALKIERRGDYGLAELIKKGLQVRCPQPLLNLYSEKYSYSVVGLRSQPTNVTPIPSEHNSSGGKDTIVMVSF
jgi:hypothetical protein